MVINEIGKTVSISEITKKIDTVNEHNINESTHISSDEESSINSDYDKYIKNINSLKNPMFKILFESIVNNLVSHKPRKISIPSEFENDPLFDYDYYATRLEIAFTNSDAIYCLVGLYYLDKLLNKYTHLRI